jgi:hypothetical protein
VVSCVVLGKEPGDTPGQFTAEQLRFFSFQVQVFGALFQNRLFERIFGL